MYFRPHKNQRGKNKEHQLQTDNKFELETMFKGLIASLHIYYMDDNASSWEGQAWVFSQHGSRA